MHSDKVDLSQKRSIVAGDNFIEVWKERVATLFMVGIFASLSFVKMKHYLPEGRFWGEEGFIFFTALKETSWYKGLYFLYNGHLEMVGNFIVNMATLVDLKYAPMVCTYLAFFFQSIPVLVIIYFRNQLGLKIIPLFAFLVILVGLPQSPEVWANATNIFFHCAVLTALILAIPVEAKYPRWLFRCLLLMSGLSGIPSNFLSPFFVARAFFEKDRERWIQSGIIIATSILQVSLLATHPGAFGGHRPLTVDPLGTIFSPLVTWLAMVSHQIISPLFGNDIGNDLARNIGNDLLGVLRKAYYTKGIDGIFFIFFCSLPFVCLIKHAVNSKNKIVIMLLLASFVTTVLSLMGALVYSVSMIATCNGGRYFFAPNFLFFLSLAIVISKKPFWFSVILKKNESEVQAGCNAHKGQLWLTVFVVMVFISSIPRMDAYFGGPSWKDAYRVAMQTRAAKIETWPGGWWIENYALRDTDRDGVPDEIDNCPTIYNSLQLDANKNGTGDVCDPNPGCGDVGQPACEQLQPDSDHDGIVDKVDNCPNTYNPKQLDANKNGVGDCCDPSPGCGGFCGQPACDVVCMP